MGPWVRRTALVRHGAPVAAGAVALIYALSEVAPVVSTSVCGPSRTPVEERCRFRGFSLDAHVEDKRPKEERRMRVMVMIKATERSEAGEMPSEELLSQMMEFNEELVKAGVMLAGDGLHPSSKGVRVTFPDRKVIDGPFAETKELLAGYWLWEVKSLDEAIEWVKRLPDDPIGEESVVEIRPVFETDDFGEEMTPELREKEQQLREQVEGRR
jgi:hypothetical protein